MELKSQTDNRNRTSVRNTSRARSRKPHKNLVFTCWDLNLNNLRCRRNPVVLELEND